MPANLENSPGPQDWKRSVFIPITKKGNEECSNYCIIALISHARKIMLKILQARFQKYTNQELSDVQAGFRKGREDRSNWQHTVDHTKSKGIPKNIYTPVSLPTLKPLFDLVDHNKLENSSRDGNIKLHYLPPEKSICRSRSNS